MKGTIRTLEKCTCGKSFSEILSRHGKKGKPILDMICTNCGIRPRSFFLYLYLPKSQFPDRYGKLRLYRGPDGRPFRSYYEAEEVLQQIRKEVFERTFELANYLPSEIEGFRGKRQLEKWLVTKEDLAPTTYKSVRQHINEYLEPYFGSLDMRKLNTAHVEDFMAQLPSKLKPKTVKNIMASLGSFARWLQRRNTIVMLPTFPTVKVPDPVITWITKQKQLEILEAIPEKFRPIFKFMMYHPLRSGEVRALKVKDFDLDHRVVHVCRAFSAGELRTRKNGRDYYLPLSETFDAGILEAKHPEAWVFTTPTGKPWSKEYLPKVWQESLESTGLPHIALKNATRHSVASQAINRGVRAEVVSRILGHSAVGVTLERYARLEVDSLREGIDAKVVPIRTAIGPSKQNATQEDGVNEEK